jgi:hypothetical protein
MIAQITSFLAGHLAAGSLFVTAVLSLGNRLPAGFLRFCTAGSAALAVLCAALSAEAPIARLLWLLLAAAAGLWYLLLRRDSGESRLLGAMEASVAMIVPALAVGLASGSWLDALGSASSCLLLGAVTVTMILGHWYLVDTSLSIAPLRSGALWVSLAVALRFAAVVLALVLGGWEVLKVSRAADIVFSTTGLFFLFRALMGLGAPLLLAGLIWQTVKIRSTQSATGLLYVALVLVLFGELISTFLRFATGYPL